MNEHDMEQWLAEICRPLTDKELEDVLEEFRKISHSHTQKHEKGNNEKEN